MCYASKITCNLLLKVFIRYIALTRVATIRPIITFTESANFDLNRNCFELDFKLHICSILLDTGCFEKPGIIVNVS